jgi:ribonuclease BN (tRNA processing enzyme)
MLNLLILGSGGAIPLPNHTPPAYWLSLDGHGILMDPGPGALVRLIKSAHGLDSVDEINTVLFSHLHPDHCADLVPLLFALHSPVLPSTKPLQLLGPRGLKNYVQQLQEVYGDWILPAKRPLIVSEIRSEQNLDPASGLWAVSPGVDTGIAVHRADHSESRFSRENLCFRFRDEQGYTLTYSGDSQFCEGLVQAARDTDLLLVECSTPDEWAVEGHMTPESVGRLCALTNPAKVVLTHFYPTVTNLNLSALVKERFSGDIVCAADDMLLTAPF